MSKTAIRLHARLLKLRDLEMVGSDDYVLLDAAAARLEAAREAVAEEPEGGARNILHERLARFTREARDEIRRAVGRRRSEKARDAVAAQRRLWKAREAIEGPRHAAKVKELGATCGCMWCSAATAA